MKLKNVLKYGVAAAALSMVLLCAPAAYAEGPEAEAAPADPAVAAGTVEDENALFTEPELHDPDRAQQQPEPVFFPERAPHR